MATLSKEVFDRVAYGKTCTDFMHPWAATCGRGLVEMFISSLKGSLKFSVALNLLQLLSKGKNINKHHFKFNFEQTVRMTAFGSCLGVLFLGSSCLLRSLLGRFDYYLSMSVPGFIGGSAIFVMGDTKRHFIISAFCGSLLETMLHHWTPLGRHRYYLKSETLLFMIINGAFLYFMRLWKTNKLDQVMPELWFYSPTGVPKKFRDEKYQHKYQPCNHIHSCVRSILKESSNYFWFGTILEVLRTTLSNFKSIAKDPKLALKFIFKRSTLRLAVFAGAYVFLYKVTNCLLCRTSGKDSAFNGLVSGFVSGLSYYIYPNLSLTITAFTNLIHICWRYFNLNEKLFGKFPTSELMFMFVCGLLFHYRLVIPDSESKFFLNMLALSTSGRSQEMYDNFARYL